MRLLDRGQCAERLRAIFPTEVVEDPRTVSGPLAATAAYVCIYLGALDGHNPIRPSMVLWMCDGVTDRARRASPNEHAKDRALWYRAALRGHKALIELLHAWGISHDPWYADNSREPLRDEVFREWLRLGAMAHEASIPTTSPRPAWTLRGDFAGLFKPQLTGEDLAESIGIWQDEHLGTVGRARVMLARERAVAVHAVEVRLPNGIVRPLAPGDSSLIIKGIVEQLAPRLLAKPGVVAISQSKKKIDVLDDELLRALGLTIHAGELLPDAVLFDGEEGRFWFVEAVATDGEIHEARKAELIRWAAEHAIRADQCGFITGFLSRTHEAFRRRVARIAWGTQAWFLDEPPGSFALRTCRNAATGDTRGRPAPRVAALAQDRRFLKDARRIGLLLSRRRNYVFARLWTLAPRGATNAAWCSIPVFRSARRWRLPVALLLTTNTRASRSAVTAASPISPPAGAPDSSTRAVVGLMVAASRQGGCATIGWLPRMVSMRSRHWTSISFGSSASTASSRTLSLTSCWMTSPPARSDTAPHGFTASVSSAAPVHYPEAEEGLEFRDFQG